MLPTHGLKVSWPKDRRFYAAHVSNKEHLIDNFISFACQFFDCVEQGSNSLRCELRKGGGVIIKQVQKFKYKQRVSIHNGK